LFWIRTFWFSGLHNPFGNPGEIVRLTSSADLTLAYDSRILSEYRSVLRRPKFSFDSKDVDDYLEFIEKTAHLTVSKPLPRRLPDPHDEVFLEIARVEEVRYLVTGNLKHFPLKSRIGVSVISPHSFIEVYRKENNVEKIE
jgi:predicted nucleic acid-binding protein